MSEKNVHQSQQWKQQKSLYEQQTTVAAAASSVYGGFVGAHNTAHSPQQNRITQTAIGERTTSTLTMPLENSSNIRFPLLQHHNQQHLQHPQQPITSQDLHVPVHSGIGVGSPSSSTSSVLSANQYSSVFGRQQLIQLKTQEPYEFNKIVSMNSSPLGSAAVAGVSPQFLLAATKNHDQLRTLTSDSHQHQPSTSANLTTHTNQPTKSTITESVLSLIGITAPGQNSRTTAVTTHDGIKIPDDDKMRKVQQVVESGISEQAKEQIIQILENISKLKPVERLLLYLRMPGETHENDPLRHPQNPLGTRSEINHTINWVRSHLEHDPQVSIPKQDVYNDYLAYCERLNIKPLSTADFGKVMKQVFPEIRPRRLGTRGHSRYCYAAMRKTTKLIPPQLPLLSETGQTKVSTTLESTNIGCNNDAAMSVDAQSWNNIKSWAENLLNVKIESPKDLADHLAVKNANSPATSSRNMLQKKILQRDETKDKRLFTDSGPLKKRRKKKRKGSSSSESSSLQPTSTNVGSPSISVAGYTASEDDQKSNIKLVSIKQEFPDSPDFQHQQEFLQISPSVINEQHHHHHPHHLQIHCLHEHQLQKQPPHQLLPMNLVSDTKIGHHQSMPSNLSANIITPVAKNLTEKIMNLSSTVNLETIDNNEEQSLIIKEENIDDYNDYNPSNVICKKVLKAHQTKGLWGCSPSSAITSVIASTSGFSAASTTLSDPPGGLGGIDDPLQQSLVSNFVMGPPAQISQIASAVPTAIDANTSTVAAAAKVASRNSLQLRAKKLRYLQANSEIFSSNEQSGTHQTQPVTSDTGDITEDKDVLPENLGLPRERVISICNMDKHELDDYLNGDEDNSQDQEAELLQYFQAGDAEFNNKQEQQLDASNPSAATTASSLDSQQSFSSVAVTTTTLEKLSASSTTIKRGNEKKSSQMIGQNSSRGDDITHLRHYLHQNFKKEAEPTSEMNQSSTQQNSQIHYYSSCAVTTTLTSTSTVHSKYSVDTDHRLNSGGGSASASLAIMSQKHQQQSRQEAEQQQEQHSTIDGRATGTQGNCQPNKNKELPCSMRSTFHKRKINLNAMKGMHVAAPNENILDAVKSRKNFIFLPISPNINSNSCDLFASPGITCSRIKPTLHKQQSLPPLTTDAEIPNCTSTTDPMIGIGGANNGRRTFFQISTSASAPPSPSQQQQQQNHLISEMLFSNAGDSDMLARLPRNKLQLHCSAANPYIICEQNSVESILDDSSSSQLLIRNSAATVQGQGADSLHDTSLTETTLSARSQSVPLHYRNSPAFNQTTNIAGFSSTCSSVVQTPVPPEFTDFSDPTTILDIFSDRTPMSSVKLDDEVTTGGGSAASADTVSNLLLNDIDVNEILSPDFVTSSSTTSSSMISKFDGQMCGGNTTMTTSSGYSSCGGGGGLGFGGIVSRSVPSTPLPHNILNTFLKKQRNNEIDDCLTMFQDSHFLNAGVRAFNGSSKYMYDISKSMPTTPITSNAATPSFRYSPEFNRDFLINGNTVDSVASSSTYFRTTNITTMTDAGTEKLLYDSLLDDAQGRVTESLSVLGGFSEVTESIMQSDILDNL